MASIQDVQLAFQRSGIGRNPTDEEVQYYASFPDAGQIEGDIRQRVGSGTALSGGIPQFNFDYAGAATQAYGELGTYYDRILRESQGDLNKALARLTQDYETGARIRKENVATSQQALDIRAQQAKEAAVNNALARGLYQQSAYAPPNQPNAFGLASENIQKAQQPVDLARQNLMTSFNRAEEAANQRIARQREDLPEQQRRREFELEQRRRRESAELANTRGSRAYQDYLNRFGGGGY